MSMENSQDKNPKKKFSKFSIADFLDSKRFRYGGFSLLMILVVVSVTILVNVGVTAIVDNWNIKLDVTSNQLYKISPQTSDIMETLSEPVEFIALYQEASNVNMTTELLQRYRQLNPDMISVSVVDPVRNPTFANQYDIDGSGISDRSVIVLNADGSRFRVVDYSDMFEMEYDAQTYQSYPKAFIGEQALTNAVVFVTSSDQQKVYFLTEHNEVPFSQYSSYVQGPIEQLNIEVGQVGVTGLEDLQSGNILIVNAPQRDLSPDEREQLRVFLEDGGRMLYMRNGGDATLENFESLLELYGVTVNHDLVVESDQAKNQMGNPTIIIPDLQDSDITESLITNSLVPVLPMASSFEISALEQYGRTVTTMLTTSDTAFGKLDLEDPSVEPSDSDLSGPRTVGLTVEQSLPDGRTTKIVVLGNSHFISTQGVVSYSGNADLFFNSVRWMQGQSSAVSIIGKSLLGSRLNITSTMHLFLLAGLCVVVIPLVLIISGLVIWFKRRHL